MERNDEVKNDNEPKTAEEILSKHTGQEGIYLTKGLIRGSDALEAMEEYANQFRLNNTPPLPTTEVNN